MNSLPEARVALDLVRLYEFWPTALLAALVAWLGWAAEMMEVFG